jgi:hypothetical protein
MFFKLAPALERVKPSGRFRCGCGNRLKGAADTVQATFEAIPAYCAKKRKYLDF